MNPQKIDIPLSNIKLAEWSHKLSTVRAHLNDVFKAQNESGEQDPLMKQLCDDSIQVLSEISAQIEKHCRYE